MESGFMDSGFINSDLKDSGLMALSHADGEQKQHHRRHRGRADIYH